jgi:TolB-like protein/cytochrome c-type biogenesis protein CcmH/NrfG
MDESAPRDKVERRLAAILIADAVGYSRLMAADEVATLDTLKGHVAVMNGLIRQHGGRVVDAVGDNLLAEFPSAVDAVACAVEVQRHLETHNAEMPPERRMLFRIGINLGDLVVEGDRIAGDGVNVAARLEALAEPGGVTVSGTVFDQVEGKLSLEFEDRGEQTVKNVPRPVRVFRVAVSSAEATGEGQTPAGATELSVPGFAGKHAIAVLPFDNLSGDVEQEYFADGIVEDLITRLSASRAVPVIARNSTFVYKGKAVDVKKVSEELGVRYVVEGSVRKAGNRVRVTAQLIDATTGHHIWAERYDRELHDIFAIQDEITETIVAAVGPELSKAEMHAALRRPAEQLDAWDCTSRALWHLGRYTREDNEKARLWARRGIELDPNSAGAYALLATSHVYEIIYRWADPPSRAAADGLRAAEKSVALDPENPGPLFILGIVCTLTRQYERAIEVLERAIERGPSSALAYFGLGMALASSGRPEDGIPMFEKATRLSPRDPWMHEFLFNTGAAHFIAERYEQAAEFAKKSLRLRADQPGVYRLLAASYGMLDRAEEAKTALQELLRLLPDFSGDHVRAFLPEAIAERYLKGLRRAGWRE